MQRRDFSRSVLAAGATAVTAGVGLFPLAAQAQPALKEGTDFLRLSKPAPVDTPAGQVEVVEFFAYSCIHCYSFEPHLSAWMKKKPAGVVVRRTPVAFSEAFVPMQRLYYTIEAMGQVDALHEKVFRAIHVDKLRLQDPAVIADWMGKQGVDMKKFNELFASFSVAGKARKATQLQDAYQVEGTPALGVAGRFYIPGQGPRTIQVAEALIAQIRKG
ncbi:MAG: thiol:disulfide interchange protein DsbA/DsbL [Hydrogenophaga sp.]|jgi:thiol:disulfide interchange protein DsbA|nr:thiol:disulfide interchange protein DsbA/DsbL [Hydrogenophaga sp.]